ncbi:YCF48-related protein [Herminiimonas sp. CN]|uniref:WD40/YVTN/BNR-like repeat-containing protein n=1 Tax=Herminiimonas sp. CN TaxID=1349818 RepID=UPI0004731603|nr:YCF48-related protein [Herminiimonas sp. CN]
MRFLYPMLCRRFTTSGLVCILSLGLEVHAQMPGPSAAAMQLKVQSAQKSAAAIHASILGAARAGKRIVAVGDYGTILLSDDDGKTFRQSVSVPVSSTLTAVSFADDKNGWAVGHWGAILNTVDAGEHWHIQRMDTKEDRPLFSVYFFDGQEGIAVGLWSIVLATRDGGKTWDPISLPTPPNGGKADRNLFKIFASDQGSLFVAAERGTILSSDDRGRTWHYIQTDYKGSFWSGIGLKEGPLLVAGLRGTIYRSTDDGRNWQAINSGTKSSITDIVEMGGKVVAVGLDGVQVESEDQGASFTWTQRDDRLSMTAAIGGSGTALVRFSKKGVVSATLPGAVANN